MLKSISIKNYRVLKDFKVSDLGNINLLTGKNNTGKTAFLEAILIYLNGGDLRMFKLLQQKRGIVFPMPKNEFEDFTYQNLQIFNSVFSYGSQAENEFSINCKSLKNPNGFYLKYQIKKEKVKNKENYILNISTTNNTNSFFKFSLKDGTIFHNYRGSNSFVENRNYVETNGFSLFKPPYLWDNIIFSEKEKNVIDALRIIEPRIEGLAFVEETAVGRVAKIKLKGNENLLSLQSMGDGINRIFSVILNLVNSENGYLNIDEFENGLHHTVQKQLWEIIFHLSEKLNIQVFATTHSEDCIRSFEAVSNANDAVEGKLFRLENKNGKISSVDFNEKELQLATEFDIEVR